VSSAAQSLKGLTLEGGWIVVDEIKRAPGSTGGHFSVGYIVKRKSDGLRGYLKALDYSEALATPNPAVKLQEMTTAFNFERDVLYSCKDHRMSRVITPLDDGTVDVPGFRELSRVDYLIFEMGDCDARAQLDLVDSFDIAWRLRSLHHVAVGMRQLHSKSIAHQDLKPSNVVVFNRDESKVGDLGCCSVRGNVSPRDSLPIAGDCNYAPPELLYGGASNDWIKRRIACDIYLLGSLVLFFFSNVNATQAILSKLDRSHSPNNWGDDFISVLPFVRLAWNEVIQEFEIETEKVAGIITPEIVLVARQLTDPDPSQRGHPMNRWGLGSPYALDRYVSKLDLLAQKARFTRVG
jgi:eukaryotic-like serine/threonine-protein kinase